jgi:hypothetical protein
MLKKLLKYDLESVYKVLSVFYILSILVAILTRIFFSFENSTMLNIIAQILNGTTIAMMVNILINNLMRVWVRFKQNLYGDESYLTHTLPISKKTIYLSKFLTSIITMTTSIIVIGITIFIAYYSEENLLMLKTLLQPIANMYDVNIISFLIMILLIFGIELISTIQSGYTGLILGHRKNSNKLMYSIAIGIATYSIIQVTGVTVMFIAGIFNPDIMDLFMTNNINNFTLFKDLMYLSIVIYAGAIIVNYFINTKLFEKGVNVD